MLPTMNPMGFPQPGVANPLMGPAYNQQLLANAGMPGMNQGNSGLPVPGGFDYTDPNAVWPHYPSPPSGQPTAPFLPYTPPQVGNVGVTGFDEIDHSAYQGVLERLFPERLEDPYAGFGDPNQPAVPGSPAGPPSSAGGPTGGGMPPTMGSPGGASQQQRPPKMSTAEKQAAIARYAGVGSWDNFYNKAQRQAATQQYNEIYNNRGEMVGPYTRFAWDARGGTGGNPDGGGTGVDTGMGGHDVGMGPGGDDTGTW